MARAEFTNNELEALAKIVARMRPTGPLHQRLSQFLDDAGSLGGTEFRKVTLTAQVSA